MAMSRKTALVIMVGSLLAATALAKEKLLTGIPLTWKPTTSITKLGMVNITGLSSVAIRFDPLTDGRPNREVVGENREDEDEGKTLPVSTSADVAAFLSEHIRQLLDESGISTVTEGGDVVISGTVKRFFVTETGRYQGEVMLAMKVADSRGNVRWEGMASGGSKRFGRSYKAENYYETLSDSVVEAVYKMLSSSEFMAALRGPAK